MPHINVLCLITLKKNEEEKIAQALDPYRVLTKGDLTEGVKFRKAIYHLNRHQKSYDIKWLREIRELLGELSKALKADKEYWEEAGRNAKVSDEAPGALIARPKLACETTVQSRERQIERVGEALLLTIGIITILESTEVACRDLRVTDQKRLDRTLEMLDKHVSLS